MQKQSGFSILELLAAVAIVTILLSIAVPVYMKAIMYAHETAAVANLRAIDTAQQLYMKTYPMIGFTTLNNLGGTDPCVSSAMTFCAIPNSLAGNAGGGTPGLQGYMFTAVATQTSYQSNADPVNMGVTGSKGFCSTDRQIIYQCDGQSGCTPGTGVPLQ